MTITPEERDAVYKVIHSRRDVRSDFISDPIPQEVLNRILMAAHHAPSVGFSQPWDFVLVTDTKIKEKIKLGYNQANQASTEMFEASKQEQYQSLKLEGILEAPLGICVTCDRKRNGPVVIGRTIKPEMDLYSTVCSIQNMWLAARAENIGLGWVSILHDDVLRNALKIPEDKVIVAYLCLGYVSKFHQTPELEQCGWLPRAELESLIHHDQWNS
ncbi:5,6-dimethylbenzimidazole synthase [Vibrio sp. SCSIO 43136]|uniref:5,6-dimethylbenzimidazole synthase n=1 Tax=Vibrio sp. SCSIO 43136 TaxID=2819101 RepID=UPI0020758498|nr:5,6-dimethylbenzimidazole synthase [Vibrio sp. SCSIO 43136]USD68180.1 5,6-dimethylbenzimidazole synthase [Vibrio sp. SCSIO 43136]